MPGLKLLTKMEPASCLKLAWRSAQNLGFALTPATPLDDGAKSFTAEKGSALVSVLAGPFAPHCRFCVSVEAYADANEVILEKNVPWLTTGSVGVKKVHRQANELMQAIASAIEKDGGTIIERKEF